MTLISKPNPYRKGYKHSDFLKKPRVQVPFYSIQSPTFEKSETSVRVENPEIEVPDRIVSEDVGIYSKEAELSGLNVKRDGWGTLKVSDGKEEAVYRRHGATFDLEGVYTPFQPYNMPITKLVEKNSVKDLEAIQDYEFLTHVEAAVKAVEE